MNRWILSLPEDECRALKFTLEHTTREFEECRDELEKRLTTKEFAGALLNDVLNRCILMKLPLTEENFEETF